MFATTIVGFHLAAVRGRRRSPVPESLASSCNPLIATRSAQSRDQETSRKGLTRILPLCSTERMHSSRVRTLRREGMARLGEKDRVTARVATPVRGVFHPKGV
jgi:hypothetical protein